MDIRRSHSSLRERMNLSMTAMLPYFPTAPKRGLIVWRRPSGPCGRASHVLNSSQSNCGPRSQITYCGASPTCLMARARNAQTSLALGCE